MPDSQSEGKGRPGAGVAPVDHGPEARATGRRGAKRFPHLPPPPDSDARIWTLRLAPPDIGHLNTILEAYEGLGIVRTADKEAALLEVWVMPGYEEDFLFILSDLARETDFAIVERERPINGQDRI